MQCPLESRNETSFTRKVVKVVYYWERQNDFWNFSLIEELFKVVTSTKSILHAFQERNFQEKPRDLKTSDKWMQNMNQKTLQKYSLDHYWKRLAEAMKQRFLNFKRISTLWLLGNSINDWDHVFARIHVKNSEGGKLSLPSFAARPRCRDCYWSFHTTKSLLKENKIASRHSDLTFAVGELHIRNSLERNPSATQKNNVISYQIYTNEAYLNRFKSDAFTLVGDSHDLQKLF